MLNEIVKHAANMNDQNLMSGDQKKNRSDGMELADDDGCCGSCCKYFRIKHYQKYFDVTTS